MVWRPALLGILTRLLQHQKETQVHPNTTQSCGYFLTLARIKEIAARKHIDTPGHYIDSSSSVALFILRETFFTRAYTVRWKNTVSCCVLPLLITCQLRVRNWLPPRELPEKGLNGLWRWMSGLGSTRGEDVGG